MPYYSYTEEVDDFNSTKVIYSEKEILEEFWDKWQVIARDAGRERTKANCIEDWCKLMWAVREDVYIFKDGRYRGKLFVVKDINPMDPTFDTATMECLTEDLVTPYVNIVTEMERYNG